MKNKACLTTALALLLLAGCGKKNPTTESTSGIVSYKIAPGDSSRYGLACDGCTDSILVLLPYEGGDPDTFDIVQAFANHHIYGRPHIGDQMAVVTSADSSRQVLMAVNMSTLHGEWHYQVSPTLRHALPPLPDSVRQRIMAPREYTLRLKNGGTAFAFGSRQDRAGGGMSPVEYPAQKHYTEWRLFNGRLLLTIDSNQQQRPDTASILLLRRDTMVLRIGNEEREFYKKVVK